MSAAKHTPGPWLAADYGHYADYEGRCRVVLGEGGEIRTAVVLGRDTPENAANARLIAAAPELLEMVRITISNVRSLGPAGSLAQVYTPYQEWLAQLEAAYLKATGGAA